MVEKPIVWMGASRAELRGFPREARRRAGHQLHLVQLGVVPGDHKPMPDIGPGVSELRIHTGVEHRVLYVAKFREAVYVLHAFEKRTRKTPRPVLDLARQRLGALLAARARGAGRE